MLAKSCATIAAAPIPDFFSPFMPPPPPLSPPAIPVCPFRTAAVMPSNYPTVDAVPVPYPDDIPQALPPITFDEYWYRTDLRTFETVDTYK